ncbi:MAG: UV DNA damage repair endonuclease UvsE [Candidatus Omnitrophica bacterium]|nr:UV DNA damage repair endonuclease UvsE [Candidatus Omnitrophota bacterium]
MIRLGLVCQFKKEPIKFRVITYRYLKNFGKKEQLNKISFIILENINSLYKSIEYCSKNKIGCFRITSKIFPLKTHPEVGYKIENLPEAEKIMASFKKCRELAKKNNIRLTFHPDQFVVLNSPNKEIVKRSIAELEYQSEVADIIGADVINIHAGGGYGNKKESLKRLASVIKGLDKRIVNKLTLENDDMAYSPQELLDFCLKHKIPFVYDVAHHRCLKDNLTIKDATNFALKTWNREPLFHLSSIKKDIGKNSCFHSDYININDFPREWEDINITIEIEAKAKEIAIKRLIRDINKSRNIKI